MYSNNKNQISLFAIIKTPITYFFWAIINFFFTVICIPLTFLPESIRYTNRLYFTITTIWANFLIFFSFIWIKKKGEENIPNYPNSPAIIIANHTSSLDIFIIENIVGNYPHIWIIKESYSKIPLFSILLKRMHVLVKRENPFKAARAFFTAYKKAKNVSSHLLIFPEGTRFNDGKIHQLHSGFALLAKKLNRPVIPIAIKGLHKIFPKKNFIINYYEPQPKVLIGKPITYKKNETIESFTKRIHQWFEEELAKN